MNTEIEEISSSESDDELLSEMDYISGEEDIDYILSKEEEAFFQQFAPDDDSINSDSFWRSAKYDAQYLRRMGTPITGKNQVD